VALETETSLTPEEEWVALTVCFDRVANILRDHAELGPDANQFFEGLKESFSALAAMCHSKDLRVPDPKYFCCCRDPEAEPAICIIHAAMALGKMDDSE
jgi:hypothetical protein